MARVSKRGGDCANGKARMGLKFRHSFLTNSKEGEHMEKELTTSAASRNCQLNPSARYRRRSHRHTTNRTGGRISWT